MTCAVPMAHVFISDAAELAPHHPPDRTPPETSRDITGVRPSPARRRRRQRRGAADRGRV